MIAPDAAALCEIGHVRKAHGIRGEVAVESPFVAEEWMSFEHVRAQVPGVKELRDVHLDGARDTGLGLLLTLTDIPDRTTAEQWRGTTFWTEREALPTLASDEFYVTDLIGRAVLTREGERVGVIEDVVTGDAQDRLMVRSPEGRQHWIPLVATWLVETRDDALVMDLPPGLLALDASRPA